MKILKQRGSDTMRWLGGLLVLAVTLTVLGGLIVVLHEVVS